MTKTNKVFVNADKAKRAETIADLVSGKRRPLNEFDSHLKERHSQILEDNKVDLKDRDAVVESIYGTLGGAVSTIERQEKIKERAKKHSIARRKLEQDEEKSDDDE